MPNNKSGGGAIDDGPGPAASTTAVSPVSRMIDMLRRFFPMDEPVPLALGAGAPGRVVLAAGASEAARPPLHDLHAHILVDERARRMVSEVFVDILAALLLRAAEGAGLEVAVDLVAPERCASFEDSVRGAAARLPHGVNLAVAAALAGNGLDRTRVTLTPDPDRSRHAITLRARSALGRFESRLMPVTDSARDLHVVAAALLAALRQADAVVWVG